MRIAINLLFLRPFVGGGTHVYALSLIKALSEIDKENEYFIFVGNESPDQAIISERNFHRVVCPIPTSRRPLRYAWEQSVLPWQLRYFKIDLVHSLGYVAPLWTHCANVVTIPDINYKAVELSMPSQTRMALQLFVPAAARRSDHVLTISNFSSDQIKGELGIAADKITVTHLGPRPTNAKASTETWEELVKRYKLPARYVVAFSSPSAHKNIRRLIQAFRKASVGLAQGLVLIGHLPPDFDFSAEVARDDDANVVNTLGFVPDEHILPLLSNADLFVFPSWYEGFGLPILEAQQAGVAVACSTAASLPEVAGDGAVFFDPYSVDEMAAVIKKCLEDEELRKTLQQKGRANCARFSWAKTAADTLDVYQKVLSKKA